MLVGYGNQCSRRRAGAKSSTHGELAYQRVGATLPEAAALLYELRELSPRTCHF
jgi:hypothetical protein